MKTLLTIFNRNDPTPTARAIRNIECERVKIFILEKHTFSERQLDNLEKFKAWILGSVRYYRNLSKDWPKEYWKDSWDWPSIQNPKIKIIEIDLISDVMAHISNGDIFDCTSGSKGQTAKCIEQLKTKGIDVSYTLQTRSGHTLNLNSGHLKKNTNDLSVQEGIWLSRGYISNFGPKGDSERGKVWLDFDVIERKKVFTISYTNLIEKLNFEESYLESGAYWFEELVADLLSLQDGLVDVHTSCRFIDPNFRNSIQRALHTLRGNTQYNELVLTLPEKFFKNNNMNEEGKILTHEQTHELWEAYVRTEVSTEKVRNAIISSMHALEVDFIATEKNSMDLLIGEVKHQSSISRRIASRHASITKAISPIYGKPIIVYARNSRRIVNGIHVIPWLDLKNKGVLGTLFLI